MSEFKIKIGAARQVKNDLNTCSRTINNIHGGIGRVKRSLRWKVQNRDHIDHRLNSLMNDIENNRSIISRCSSILDQVINEYTATEYELVYDIFQKAVRESLKNPWPIMYLKAYDFLTPISILAIDWAKTPKISDFWDIDSVKESIESLKEKSKKSKSLDWEKKKERSDSYIITKDGTYLKTSESELPDDYEEITDEDELKKVQKEYDDFEKAEKALKDADTIYEKEVSGDVTLWEKNGEFKSGNLSNEYDVKFGSAEAHASAAVTTVGLAAEVGASFTTFSAEDTLMYGDDMLGVYAKGQVEALKAEANANAQIGIVEVDGKKVVAAHAGASAEAILVDASIKGGAKVLGTDVSGSVGVNVGIGAHADVGFQGGKLKFDVGASLGVGVSADFEVDFSGTIDAICGNALNIASATTNVVDNVANAASDAFNFIGGLFGG